MFIPSTLVWLAGALALAAVAAADWYLWGLNLVVNPRQPRRPQPLTGLELIDMGLGRLMAANRAVLPKAALEAGQVNSAPLVTDPDDGFKRVA